MAPISTEDRARTIWRESLAPDLAKHERRGKVIAATRALAEALIEQLAGYEIDAAIGTAHQPPGSPDADRVICLQVEIEVGSAVIPLVPGALSWQLIPAAPGGPHGRLYPNDEPAAEIGFPSTAADPQDRWIPVSMLVAQLLTVLGNQTATEEQNGEPVS